MGTSNPSPDPWIGYLLDEYKILQDKLDKIGAFRFTIKGWSVTVTAAALAAATATNASPVVALVPLLIAAVFFKLEWGQHRLSAIYVERVLEIEIVLSRLRAGTLTDLSSIRFVPGIATLVSRVALRRQKYVPWKKVRSDPEYLIYPVQGLVILAVAAIQVFRAAGAPVNPAGNYIFFTPPAAESAPAPAGKPPAAEPPAQKSGSESGKPETQRTSEPKQPRKGGKGRSPG